MSKSCSASQMYRITHHTPTVVRERTPAIAFRSHRGDDTHEVCEGWVVRLQGAEVASCERCLRAWGMSVAGGIRVQ